MRDDFLVCHFSWYQEFSTGCGGCVEPCGCTRRWRFCCAFLVVDNTYYGMADVDIFSDFYVNRGLKVGAGDTDDCVLYFVLGLVGV